MEQAGTRVFDPDAFMQIGERARSIHFTGEAFKFDSYVRWAQNDGQLRIGQTVTNWELRTSLANWASKFVLR